MRKRHELMDKLAVEALEKIKEFAQPNNQTYKDLMKQLIVEGMVKMLEPTAIVRVRNNDVDFVKKLFPECEKIFKDLMMKETENEYKCTLELDDKYLESEW